MCNFKSGIILKNKCVIAQGSYDSHTDLLNELNIEDTTQNAMTKFVRAELLPPNDKWWTDPETWSFCVDQDIVPDWYETDKTKYEEEFRNTVKEWWTEHVLVDKKIDELSSGYYRLKRCEVEKLVGNVQVMCDSSSVHVMYDGSSVQEMWGDSSVQKMYNNSSVSEIHDSSLIQSMFDSSSVQVMCDNSSIQNMFDSSLIQSMFDTSSVQKMFDSSSVQKMYDSSSVSEIHGNSSVTEMCDTSSVQKMFDSSSVQVMCDNSSIQNMFDSSSVQSMYDSSIARDYTNGIIRISSESNLKSVVHENQS